MLSRNIAEQLIEKGLASAVRHKRDDEDRSPDYDKLMAAEQTYAAFQLTMICSAHVLSVLPLRPAAFTLVKSSRHRSNHLIYLR